MAAQTTPSVRTGRTGLERASVQLRDGSVVVRDLTLLAEPGELLAILGPSGSGKSSILRAIAGLETLVAGRVLIGGEPVATSARHDVAMVFQDTHLLPFLDAARNMSFPLDVVGMAPDDARARVEDQASRLRIRRLLRRAPATLSPGESARVGLGRALVREPRAFLLDEPLAHLDATDRLRMRHQLREVVTGSGVSTLLVTHDQAEALALGDRVAVIVDGALVQVGTARELYDTPATAFVADFAAPAGISLLPAQLIVASGLAGYRIGEQTLPAWTAPPPRLAALRDREVLLGIRPEDVHEHPLPEHGTLTGVVRSLEHTGAHATARILVGDHQVQARLHAHTSVRPGDAVTVGVDAARAHVFDARTRFALAHPSVEPH